MKSQLSYLSERGSAKRQLGLLAVHWALVELLEWFA